MADINLNIGGNTSQLMRDIEKTVDRVYSINLKTKGEQPLGRITGKVNEFNKSLDASNARVIAFGASAGLIFGVQRAFSELARATVEVQKSLQDINVILNVSASQLQKFGGELFSIAKNTGQSFNSVAEAATEFSRQGLGVVETLKRTNEALILSRLSGLDTVKSVEALTAAINSFAGQAVTATDIVNKFATVDAAFAVSSADLADAIARVGSSAAQSGVSLNELIAIVTSAQQTTARGGAVIGNSFKTIFTRLQRTKVISLLESLGVETTGADGQLKSTISLLQDLGRVYDTLGTQQQSYVAEQVGGVFQINILKAALADLGKEYSIYNSALDVAAGATDQAVKRNEELNKTYAAQLNALKENARQAGANVGGRLFGPAFDRVVGNANELLGGFNESDGEGVGAVLGKGILDGLGQVIAGPGLVLIGGVLFKLFKDLAGFATQSFQQLLGLNTASTQQRDLQQSINQILQKNPQLLELALKGEQGLAAAAATLLQNLRAQTAELQKQATVSAQLAKTFYASGVRVSSGVPLAPTPKTAKVKSGGFIPNFAFQRELSGIKKSGDYTSSQKRKAANNLIYDSNFPGLGPTVYNGQESIVQSTKVAEALGYPAGTKPKNSAEKYSILTPAMVNNLGVAAKGFIPNFAVSSVRPYIDYAQSLGLKVGNANSPAYKEVVRLANRTRGGQLRSEAEIKDDIKQLSVARKGTVGAANALKGAGKFAYMYAGQGAENTYKGRVALTKDSKPVPFDFSTVGLRRPYTFEDDINEKITPVLDDLAAKVIPEGSSLLKVGKSDFNEFIDKSAFNQLYGRLFEAVINRAIGKSVRGEAGTSRFEFFQSDLSGQYSKALNDIFSSSKLSSFAAADLKFRAPSPESASVLSFVKKMAAQSGVPYDKTAKIAARGFIPNFNSTNRGVPVSQIRAHFDKNGNPIAVTNTRDEPNGLKDAIGRERKGIGMSSGGFIPNFAGPATPTSDVATAIGVQLAAILPMLALTAQRGDEYAKSLQTISEENKKAGKVTNQYAKTQLDGLQNLRSSYKITASQFLEQSKKISDPYAASTGQKLGARFGGGGGAAFAAATIAPILAETLKQGIDQTTKEGRRNAAITSGVGQTAAFAATGFAVGGPIGAAVGAIAGAGLTLKSVLDEINTDLPELSAAAQQASEGLTKFNDQSQKILTGFEQIKQLREGGQATRAGEIEAQLLKDVSIDFAESPDLALKATTAILNKDFKSLSEALNANSEILVKQAQEKSRQESITKSIESLGKEGVETKIGKQAAKDLGLDFFRNVDVTQGSVATGNIDTLVEEFQKYQRYVTQVTTTPPGPTVPGGAPVAPIITAERVTKEDLIASIGGSGLSEAAQEILVKLIQEQDSVEGAILALEEFKKNVENGNAVQASIANNTGKNNKLIRLIQDALSKVSSNFNKLASLSSETLAIQSTFNQAKQEALSAIQVEDLSGRAEVAEAFGGQEQSRKLGIQAERAKISGDFDKEVGTALATVTDLIGQSLTEGISQGFKNIGSFGEGTPEEKAKQQLAEAQRLSGAVLPENILQQVQSILNADQFKQGTGVLDTNAIIEALQKSQDFAKLSPEDQTKTLDQVRQEISKSNQTLQKSLVVQQQQLTIVANQKLNQIIKELANAVINSFGGIEKFITGKALDDTIADDIKEILAERESLRNAVGGGTPDRGTETEMGRRAGRLLDSFTDVLGGRGGIFTENTGLVQEEIQGQANNIEDIFNTIRDAAMSPGASAAEQEAFEKTRQALIEQSGVQPGAGDDMRPVFEEIARIQSLERRKSGEISTGIRDNAVKKLAELDPKLAELLKFDEKGNLISGGALDSADLSLKYEMEQTGLLQEIRDILSKAESEVPKAEFEQRAGELQALEDAIVAPAAQAGIQLPGTEGITDAIYNNIPMLGDFNTPFAFGPTDFTSLTDPNASAQALGGGPGVPSWVEAAQGNLTDQNYYAPLYDAGASIQDLFGDGTDRSFLNKPSLNYEPFQSPSDFLLPRTPDSNNFPIGDPDSFIGYKDTPNFYGAGDIQTRLGLQDAPAYNVTPGLGVGLNPTNETFEETSQLRDSIQEEISAVNNLTISMATLSEQLGRGNAEAGANQNLTGGTFGDITVSPAAINVTVEGSLGADKVAEIEKVLREQSDQNINQVIAELNQKVSRLEELGNNITAQNPGVRPPPRGTRQ